MSQTIKSIEDWCTLGAQVRIPFWVPWWQVALSGSLQVGTCRGMTWVAGKAYRTGILMYGKKNSFKEIWKWLRYTS